MKYKTYTREEYLKWCKEHNVKSPLPENRRNKYTECGYPAHPYDPNLLKQIVMTDKEKKRLHDIQNVPVNEDELRNNRRNIYG